VSNVLADMLALVVEDQPLIALDTEAMLSELGASSVASFSSADQALVWLQSGAPAVAILDVNLGGTSSFAVADELSLRGIPFAFTTGYADTVMIPSRFSHIRVVQKPYSLDSLAQTLVLCLTAAGTQP
jgi:CheY-like chemotaxis protein